MHVSGAALAQFDPLNEIPGMERELFGNTVHAYILTLLSFLVIWAALHLVRHYVLTRIGRREGGSRGDAWTATHHLLSEIRPYVFPLVALYAATKRLTMPDALDRGLHLVTVAVVTIQVVRFTGDLISLLIMHSRPGGRADDPVIRSTNHNIAALVKIGLWVAGLLFFLDNAGFNVSTFVAGLGIGGVAIALAAQAILGDTFSSFAIALDKPFEVGDYINVDSLGGTVEHIGLKTTRVRSSSGELLVFANSDLTKSRIKNYKRMYQRRVSFKLNVHPSTPIEKLRILPGLLASVVEEHAQHLLLERSHFVEFGDSSLIFEVGYLVKTADYMLYMDTQQAMNLRLVELLDQEGIELTFHVMAPVPARAPTVVAATVPRI